MKVVNIPVQDGHTDKIGPDGKNVKRYITGQKLQIEPNDSMEDVIEAVDTRYPDLKWKEHHRNADGSPGEQSWMLEGVFALIAKSLDLQGRQDLKSGQSAKVGKEALRLQAEAIITQKVMRDRDASFNDYFERWQEGLKSGIPKQSKAVLDKIVEEFQAKGLIVSN